MGKGGGSVDTSNLMADRSALYDFANTAKRYAVQNWDTGNRLLTSYETPVLDQLKSMLMGATGQGAQPGQYVDPLMNILMGQPTEQANQAATMAKKNILNQNMGPGAQATALQNVDLQKMGGLQSSSLKVIQDAIQQLIGAGQQGTGLMANVPGQISGAGGLIGAAGQLDSQMAQLQSYASQQNNMGLLGGLQGIGQIAGLFGGMAMGGGPLGLGLWGAGAGARAGGGGGAPSMPTMAHELTSSFF